MHIMYVVLDNCYGELPNSIAKILSGNKCCYGQTAFGEYIFTPDWQIAVESIEPIQLPSIIEGEPENPIVNKNNDFATLYFHNCIENKVGSIKLGKYIFSVIPTADGLLRVRKIIKKYT